MLRFTSPHREGLRVLAIWLLLTAGAMTLPGLSPEKAITQYSHSAWRVAEGLPQNTVRALAQTPDGYLWIATEAGLARFDGVQFTVFDRQTHPHLFANPHIYTLATDWQGALWIGTNGGGLVRYFEGRFQLFTTDDGLPTGRITALAPDGEALWIGTYGGGLVRHRDGAFEVFDTRQGLTHNVIFDLEQDPRGGVWIATYGGGLDHFSEGRFTVLDQAQGLSSNNVWSVERGRDGTLWIGTNAGLDRLRNGELRQYSTVDGLSHNRVISLLEDTDGNLWAGTYGGGLNLFRDDRFSHIDKIDGLTSPHIWTLFEDREGTLWVGTLGGGLNQLKDGPFTSYSLAEGLSSDLPSSFFEDRDGSLWITSRTRGADHLTEAGVENWGLDQGLSSPSIWVMLRDRNNGLWFGTSGAGLDYFGPAGKKQFKAGKNLADDTVFALNEDQDGAIWIGTNKGLCRYRDGLVDHFGAEDGLASDQIRAFLEDRSGHLWIGTTGGLTRYDGQDFVSYTTQDGLSSNNVWTIHEDAERDGVFWIGTGGGGLVRFKDSKFNAFTTQNGFFDDILRAVVEDDMGHLWVSSSRGIIRIAKDVLNEAADRPDADGTSQPLPYVRFGIRDGMKSDACYGAEPAGIKTRDGRIWFTTLDGVTVVDPAAIEGVPAPRVILEHALADDTRLLDPAQPPPKASTRSYNFQFSAPTLLVPEKIRLRYRLLGFDDAWRPADAQRSVTYNNLRAGDYVFEVMASDEYGSFNGPLTRLSFSVLPTFYQTWKFFGLCTLALIGLAFGLHALRIRHLKRREQDLNARVAESLAHIKVLRGLLPICASCKKIRGDEGYWQQLESFLAEHTEASLSHGMCPDCIATYYPGIRLDPAAKPTPVDP